MKLNNRIIKHSNNLDVCYLVSKCFDAGHKLKLKVTVQNMGYVQSYNVGVDLKITIKKEDLPQWHVCIEPDAKCLRYAEWKRIV